jgi:hypothetical protein
MLSDGSVKHLHTHPRVTQPIKDLLITANAVLDLERQPITTYEDIWKPRGKTTVEPKIHSADPTDTNPMQGLCIPPGVPMPEEWDPPNLIAYSASDMIRVLKLTRNIDDWPSLGDMDKNDPMGLEVSRNPRKYATRTLPLVAIHGSTRQQVIDAFERLLRCSDYNKSPGPDDEIESVSGEAENADVDVSEEEKASSNAEDAEDDAEDSAENNVLLSTETEVVNLEDLDTLSAPAYAPPAEKTLEPAIKAKASKEVPNHDEDAAARYPAALLASLKGRVVSCRVRDKCPRAANEQNVTCCLVGL